MTGLVLEIRNGEAAILLKNGEINRIKDAGYEVGETIETSGQTRIFRFPKALGRAVAAAAIILVVALAGGNYYYTTVEAAGFVTMSGNMSLQYVLNRKIEVIAVNGLDAEGREVASIMEKQGYKKKSLTEALEQAVAVRADLGGTRSAGNGVTTISVSSDDAGVKSKLEAEVDEWIEQTDAVVYEEDFEFTEVEADDLPAAPETEEDAGDAEDTEDENASADREDKKDNDKKDNDTKDNGKKDKDKKTMDSGDDSSPETAADEAGDDIIEDGPAAEDATADVETDDGRETADEGRIFDGDPQDGDTGKDPEEPAVTPTEVPQDPTVDPTEAPEGPAIDPAEAPEGPAEESGDPGEVPEDPAADPGDAPEEPAGQPVYEPEAGEDGSILSPEEAEGETLLSPEEAEDETVIPPEAPQDYAEYTFEEAAEL